MYFLILCTRDEREFDELRGVRRRKTQPFNYIYPSSENRNLKRKKKRQSDLRFATIYFKKFV